MGPELLQRTDTTNEHFKTILAMEDAMQQRRNQHRDSNSSVESLASSSSNSLPREKEGRRSITFGQSERPKSGEVDGEGLARKFKGRLRALTGGNREAEPYPGT